MRRSAALFALWFLPFAALSGAGLGCAAYRYQHQAAVDHGGAAKTSAAAVPQRLRAEVDGAKGDLARGGKYACCIKPSCDYCLLHEGECTCREMVEMMGPGCGECTQGWLEGRGAVPGVDVGQFLDERAAAHRHDTQTANPPPP